MADLKISALNSLAGADLVAADVVAVVDDSASETKKLTVSDLIANGTTLISDATIPSAKILFAAGAIDTAELAASAVETAKINDSAVTAAKLADNSSVTLVSTLPASGDFTGQIALDTDDDKIYIWDGSAWDSVKGAGSINVVNGSTSGIVNITTSTSGDTVTISTSLDDTSAAANFLAGPTGAGGTVGYRAIAGSDLPKATTSTKGAVVVNGNGLTMSNDEIQINNSVTAETTNHHVVQYDANGLITAGREITGADIPSATSSVKGSVFPGTGLAVTAAGELNHSNNITGGTFTKVTVDTEGHVTATTDLVASDIPDLPASKITTGTLPTERLANDAITSDKLANESTTKFIGAGATDNVVTFPDGDFKGQFAYDEKNEDLYVYTGNSFIPITVISGNLVNAGTYNASTNLLTSVTTAGSAAGFTSGGSLPTPATTNLNYYVVVDTSGTGSGAAPSVALAPPDMLVSLGTGATFQLVDVSNAIAGQTAANISVVPVGSIAATDAQAALQELDTEKLPKAGGTMTGNLELGDGIVIVFEGATANDYETTLTVTDPTADRTITLPDETGTVLTTGASGAVTSAMIADGTIVNADISASAGIAVSKLANGTARQLLQTDSTGADVEFTSNIDVPGTLDCTGAGTFDSSLTVTGVINADGKVKFPAGTAALPSFYNGTDTDTGLYFSAANEISVSTGGTQRVVVDSSGNVGVGVASPSQKLHIQGTGTTRMQITGGSSATARINFGDTDDPDIGMIIYDNANNSLQFVTNVQERLRIDSSGNVGIGTSSPDQRLEVSSSSLGTAVKISTSANQSAVGDVHGEIVFEGKNSSGTVYETAEIKSVCESSAGTRMAGLAFTTSGPTPGVLSEKLRIDSSGRLLVGTSSAQGNSLLQVEGDSSSGAAQGSLSLRRGLNTAAIGGNVGADLGQITFGGNDGTVAATIRSQSDATWSSTSDCPGNIQFLTTADGASSATERVRIDSSGRLLVGSGAAATPLADDGGLDISSNNSAIVIGGSGSGARANNATKDGKIVAAHYTNTEEPVVIVRAISTSTENTLYWGGFTGTSNAATSHRFYTAANNTTTSGSERMRIDSSGRLIIGASSARVVGTTRQFTIEGTDSPTASASIFRNSNSAGGAVLALGKSRGTSNGSSTVLQSGDQAGAIFFNGADGTDAVSQVASISAEIDGTPGSNDMPGRLVFNVTADGSDTVTEAMRIDSKQRVTVKAGAIAEIDALTDAATITPDLATSCNFSVTLAGNRTLANPSNITAGQSGSIFVTQDGTGSRTLAFGSYWDFAGGTAPTLTTTASAVDRIDYIVRSSTSIHAVATLAYS